MVKEAERSHSKCCTFKRKFSNDTRLYKNRNSNFHDYHSNIEAFIQSERTNNWWISSNWNLDSCSSNASPHKLSPWNKICMGKLHLRFSTVYSAAHTNLSRRKYFTNSYLLFALSLANYNRLVIYIMQDQGTRFSLETNLIDLLDIFIINNQGLKLM